MNDLPKLYFTMERYLFILLKRKKTTGCAGM